MKKRHIFLACTALIFASNHALAIGNITSPNIDNREIEFEYTNVQTFSGNASKREREHEFEIAIGLSEQIKIEFEGKFEKSLFQSTEFKGFEFGGIYQFFPTGEKWADFGIKAMYVAPKSGNDALEIKFLGEKQVSKWVNIVNLAFEKEIGKKATKGTEIKAAFKSQYQLNYYFNPAIEIQSNFGDIDDGLKFNQQEHYFGPTFSGHIAPRLKYDFGYLFGVSNASAAGGLRFKIEFETYF